MESHWSGGVTHLYNLFSKETSTMVALVDGADGNGGGGHGIRNMVGVGDNEPP
jgi:hypothetical protein